MSDCNHTNLDRLHAPACALCLRPELFAALKERDALRDRLAQAEQERDQWKEQALDQLRTCFGHQETVEQAQHERAQAVAEGVIYYEALAACGALQNNPAAVAQTAGEALENTAPSPPSTAARTRSARRG